MIADYGRPYQPRDGQVWMQSIEEILDEFYSCDSGAAGGCMCRSDLYDNEEFDHSTWDCVLNDKRFDTWYDDVKDSIQDRGFVRPVIVYTRTIFTDPEEPLVQWFMGDGHHRLAAAIDLGLTHIPVEFQSDQRVSYDSSIWTYDDMIPLFTRRAEEPAIPRF